MIANQPLKEIMAIIRSIDLILVEIMWSTLKSQENCLSQKTCLCQKNRKAKKRLSLKIWLSQKKSCQKVGIKLISTLRRPNQSS